MTVARDVLNVEVVTTDAARADVELLVQPIFEGEPLGGGHPLASATAGDVGRAVASGAFKGKLFELFFAPIVDTQWRARRVLLAGLGRREDYGVDRARRLAAAAGLAARQQRHARVAMIWTEPADLSRTVQAIVEGFCLSDFDAARHKTGGDEPGALQSAQVVLPRQSVGELLQATRAAAERGRVLGESCNLARGLANEPGNLLTPSVFSERASTIAEEAGLTVEILDERQIAELKMGLLLAVARGSVEVPRVIVLKYRPPGAPANGPVLGLVGKGITFDSGGISLKPADGMERMKDDMAGGAAVLGAMRAIALLKTPLPVVGVIPSTENMPGSRAVKPGDIIRSAAGKTVEVVNTDAEGRLVLADALWYAQRLGATHLVDVATLTGSCVVALGKGASGLFGTPDAWVNAVRAAADRAGDRVWPMPLFEDYREQLRSDIADFTNTGGRPAGAITAALFLKEFVGALPWAHLDIAGTAWIDEAKPYMKRGASGVAVRTLAELASMDWTSDTWPR